MDTPATSVNTVVDAAVMAEHHEIAYKNGSSTLTTQTAVFGLVKKQIDHLHNKFAVHLVRDAHGQDDRACDCWTLPPISKEQKDKKEYTRLHKDVQTRRGAYVKHAYYSFSGKYAQVTYTLRRSTKSLTCLSPAFPRLAPFNARILRC